MKFAVGDKVYCKKYGKGTCLKIDKFSPEFMYFVKFKDGTLIWLSKSFVERQVSAAKILKQSDT